MTIDRTLDNSSISGLTPDEIEGDRKKWSQVITDLNKNSQGITYELRKSERDGYYYITPITEGIEAAVNDTKDLHPRVAEASSHWTDIIFSDKQFSDTYFAWSKNPKSDFILDMIPNNTENPQDYTGRFSYHPIEKELLLASLSIAHSATISQFGNFEFNEYQRGIYVREKKIILIRPYFNPKDKEGNFDPYTGFDKQANDLVTNITIRMIKDNGLPYNVKIIRDVDNKIVKKYTEIFI